MDVALSRGMNIYMNDGKSAIGAKMNQIWIVGESYNFRQTEVLNLFRLMYFTLFGSISQFEAKIVEYKILGRKNMSNIELGSMAEQGYTRFDFFYTNLTVAGIMLLMIVTYKVAKKYSKEIK